MSADPKYSTQDVLAELSISTSRSLKRMVDHGLVDPPEWVPNPKGRGNMYVYTESALSQAKEVDQLVRTGLTFQQVRECLESPKIETPGKRITTDELMSRLSQKSTRTLLRWVQLGLVDEPTRERHPEGKGMINTYSADAARAAVLVDRLRQKGLSYDEVRECLALTTNEPEPDPLGLPSLRELSVSVLRAQLMAPSGEPGRVAQVEAARIVLTLLEGRR